MTMKSLREAFRNSWTVAVLLLAGFLPSASFAANTAPLPSVDAAQEIHLSFADLAGGALALQGVQSSAHVNLGTRGDEAVVGAKLHLRFTYSPSLLAELSHLRVSVNGQVVAALPLPKADAGREIERDLTLDTVYFSDYNDIRFDLIGHYSMECEDPQHSSLWLSISPLSELKLEVRPIELRDELAFLPAPFFDRRDGRMLTLPVMLAANASRDVVRSAGVAASWFGSLADYRGARFPVKIDALPTQHALVFATNDSRPAALGLPAVDVPTVRIIDSPANPFIKLLVFQGRDDAQLRQAVEGLVLGDAVLTGSSATISAVTHARRAAYDAPRWLRTDRAVKLGELVDSPGQLQAQGLAPPPITLNLRLPPDLFTWNRAGAPFDLHYRYTAPAEKDSSLLTISVNNQLLRSYRLTPESDSSGDGRFSVPLLQTDASRQSRGLLIPAFQLASNNQMQFRFALAYHRTGLCQDAFTDNSREAIDPDSTIDISGFPHYAALPDLTLFANAGYPFTRFADLAETAIVLPDASDRVALEQLLFVLGRMGRQTGAVALGYRLLDTEQALQAKDLDLLILSGPRSNDLVSHWGQTLPLTFDATQRHYRDGEPAAAARTDWAAAPRDNPQAGTVQVRASGALGSLMSFESPLSTGRTVVALLATDANGADALIGALGDDAKVALIRGGLTILRGGDLQSYQSTKLYYVGSLSWWQWLWFHLAQHALLLIVVCLATAITAALLIYGWLQRLAARRLEPRPRTSP
jgi:hypothetical protein